MVYLGLLLIGLSALGFLAWVHTRFWSVYYAPEHGADEIHFATTSDGWRLALHRYACHAPSHARQPVVLCHGVANNRHAFDLDEQHSLARFLQSQGWDVWILELRGSGMSSKPNLLGRFRWGWSVDAHVLRDLPAALDKVRTVTRAPAVHWVGHGLGGLLGLIHAQTEGALHLRSLTLMGASPFTEHEGWYAHVPGLVSLVTWLPHMPVGNLARFAAPFGFGIAAPFLTHNGANVPGKTVRRALSSSVENISSGVARQMTAWIGEPGLSSTEGGTDFLAGLTHVRTPLLTVAGARDRLARAEGCRQVTETVASSHRRLRVLEDYGHADLLIGESARLEVFPIVGEWLEQRAEDALPPPLPDVVVDLAVERDLDFEAEPENAVETEGLPPAVPTLEGPYGLLNRFSPTRRRQWIEERERFRRFEAMKARRRSRFSLQRHGVDVQLEADEDVLVPEVLPPDETVISPPVAITEERNL